VGAALQVKSQANAIADVIFQFLEVLRKADYSQDASQHYHADKNRSISDLHFHG
jgi:hypothetical protein